MNAVLILGALLFSVADDPTSRLEVTLRKPQDKIEIKISAERAVISVLSESGIGGAQMKLAAGKWPKEVVLKLALKELEGFNAECGDLRIHTGLGHDKPEVFHRAADGTWKEAKAEDRHVVKIGRADGRIEVVLPAVLFTDERKAVSVQWIDYYRG
jgi:hypothetical protein